MRYHIGGDKYENANQATYQGSLLHILHVPSHQSSYVIALPSLSAYAYLAGNSLNNLAGELRF